MPKAPALPLDRILEPVAKSLNSAAARSLLGLQVDADVQARMAVLADKCNEGLLSEDERIEYESYIWAGKVVALLQAKARVLLR